MLSSRPPVWRLAFQFCAVILLGLSSATTSKAQQSIRIEGQWASILIEAQDGARALSPTAYADADVDTRGWRQVAVPHNWQGYAYNRQLRVGARHGVAWYRKTVAIAAPRADERIALRFEGVNSYASIWINGQAISSHAGGLTSFAVDITDAVRPGDNQIAVRLDNPAGITDLPWISGDDQPENGFAEGSQPFGIFRPVHVERSSALRVKPMGAYAWGAPGAIDAAAARLTARVELENRSDRARQMEVEVAMIDADGRTVTSTRFPQRLAAGQSASVERALPAIVRPRLWSPDTPYLHSLVTIVREDGRIIDETRTTYGIRDVVISKDANGQRRLLVNGKPVFLRGIAEYEHMLGGSHAFSDAQVVARVGQARAAGFNAFRDAHYPHNLRYGQEIARTGMLWWPQFSAHIWFDNPAFRANFRARLEDWVRERRNNPAVFLWGLQNESRLPADFAREMVAVIRELDPTASRGRLVVTCNGGEGADWNVPQNWSGTYGGDPLKFGKELAEQGLVGEYGGWRSIDLHAEAPAKGTPPTSEEHFAGLMQTKARLAETAADKAVGHFQWLLATHENPGRPMRADGTQIWDGVRALDHIGPANNKGLMTLWGEPTDAYYMYRARNVSATVAPMVYIVSHSWPDRWRSPGIRSGIEVYSNCEAVELFNDASAAISLGRKRRDAEGRFVWNDMPVRYDRLAAHCLIGDRIAARDQVRLNNLPAAPGDRTERPAIPSITAAEPGYRYLYRVNAGGDAHIDAHGQRWDSDRQYAPGRQWGWESWAQAFTGLDPMLGSRRPVFDPVEGTDDPTLFDSLRFGRDALAYRFRVPDGRYRIELYFVEPWYGRAGIDARGWRLFDVAVNGRTVIDDLDLFAQAGFGRAVRHVVDADISGGELRIDFPEVKAGQAVLSAIAIANRDDRSRAAIAPPPAESDMVAAMTGKGATLARFVDNGDIASGQWRWTGLSPALLDSDAVQPHRSGDRGSIRLRAREALTLYRAIAPDDAIPTGWQASEEQGTLIRPDNGKMRPMRFVTRALATGEAISLPLATPLLLRRALPSPYAPGNFTFAKDRALFEAEDKAVTGKDAPIANRLRGHSGPGYVAIGARPGTLSLPVESGAAARRTIQIRYQVPPGAERQAQIVLIDSSGIAIAQMPMTLEGGSDWQVASVQTPGFINAGSYRLQIKLAEGAESAIDSIRFE
ncbi:malectin domain-containing carbohydrate-binding protein [Sphingobium aromaticiconvertens]|uniref:malectin domain-containing carbohydrate-binding protein n=1 Tax=Sphingobium aromaticiconvertens TaxID=365341 RepID=UPI0030165885